MALGLGFERSSFGVSAPPADQDSKTWAYAEGTTVFGRSIELCVRVLVAWSHCCSDVATQPALHRWIIKFARYGHQCAEHRHVYSQHHVGEVLNTTFLLASLDLTAACYHCDRALYTANLNSRFEMSQTPLSLLVVS